MKRAALATLGIVLGYWQFRDDLDFWLPTLGAVDKGYVIANRDSRPYCHDRSRICHFFGLPASRSTSRGWALENQGFGPAINICHSDIGGGGYPDSIWSYSLNSGQVIFTGPGQIIGAIVAFD